MSKEEKQITHEKVFDGHLLHVYKDKVLCPNGNESTREYIMHQGASCILAFLPDGRIIMEKQFRYPFHKEVYELPAGKLDPNESNERCAIRELEEETGWHANKMEYYGAVYPSIAYTDEVIHLYVAKDLVKSEQHLDKDETLEVLYMTLDEVVDMIAKDEIRDSKTIALISRYVLKNG